MVERRDSKKVVQMRYFGRPAERRRSRKSPRSSMRQISHDATEPIERSQINGMDHIFICVMKG